MNSELVLVIISRRCKNYEVFRYLIEDQFYCCEVVKDLKYGCFFGEKFLRYKCMKLLVLLYI